jgi:transketolase
MKLLKAFAKTIRGLSIDAIKKANSGHPGLPLGCADIGSVLFNKILRFNPLNPHWLARDRFVLSAGHGSMLLYACLYLSGYDLTLDDIQSFREYKSKLAGHPEYGHLPGVEATTGPLGQGVAMSVGMALGNKIIQEKFFSDHPDLWDAKIFVLAGDGCLMEGVSAEAASLAGHLKLDNLVVIYDANRICLDGKTSECFTENVMARFAAYGWHTKEIDGHSYAELETTLKDARHNKGAPLLIMAHTIIGKGTVNLENTNEVHGKALSEEEMKLTKENLGIPLAPTFYVPEEVQKLRASFREKGQILEQEWQDDFKAWAARQPEKAQAWALYNEQAIPKDIDHILKNIEVPQNVASRQASGIIIQGLKNALPYLITGSADLSGSDNSALKNEGIVQANNYACRNIKYGVREFAMGAMAMGLSLQSMLRPLIGTFLVFSDYMRNALRLAALMNLPVIYQFTHDSFLLGEDGPTHQPVEHLAALRAIPNFYVFRPADTTEVKGAWSAIIKLNSPAALVLSRQNLPDLAKASFEAVAKGAYIIKQETRKDIDYLICATGSEMALALDIAQELELKNKSVRVISFPCFKLFDKQTKDYQNKVLGGHIKSAWAIEAQSSFGWHKYIGKEGQTITIDEFGLSGPACDLANHFGFTKEKIMKKMLSIND